MPCFQTLELVEAPIVEDGRAPITAAEAFRIHPLFPKLLTEIQEEGIASTQGGDSRSEEALPCRREDEVRGESLLIVVLSEVAHRCLVAADSITHSGEVSRITLTLAEGNEEVIDPDLVIEIVKASTQIFSVAVRLINLGEKEDLWVLLAYRRNRPRPEGGRDELGHIAAEAIDATTSPVAEDVAHLHPRVGVGIGVQTAPSAVVYTVVELHGLVPVVDAGVGTEAVVARSTCRVFPVWG